MVIRETLARLLVSEGCDVALASGGIEALAKAAELAPDLIVLDIMMPVMDGLEVCRRLRADPLLAEVPVIMVTAMGERGSFLAGLEAGADDFIPKPFDTAELPARVRTITRLDRYRRLLLAREKFGRVIELAPNGIMIVEAGGEIRLVNPAILWILGAGQEQDVTGKKILAFLAPEHSKNLDDFFKGIVADFSQSAQIESSFVRLDGSFPLLRQRLYPRADSS